MILKPNNSESAPVIWKRSRCAWLAARFERGSGWATSSGPWNYIFCCAIIHDIAQWYALATGPRWSAAYCESCVTCLDRPKSPPLGEWQKHYDQTRSMCGGIFTMPSLCADRQQQDNRITSCARTSAREDNEIINFYPTTALREKKTKKQGQDLKCRRAFCESCLSF